MWDKDFPHLTRSEGRRIGPSGQAAASLKSFKKTGDEDQPRPDDPGNPTVDFHGEKRSNNTHQSTTDPEALLSRKGNGKEAKLNYAGRLLMENRNGLAVDVSVTQATGTAERDEGVKFARKIGAKRRVTLGRQKLRHIRFRGKGLRGECDAARCARHPPPQKLRDR